MSPAQQDIANTLETMAVMHGWDFYKEVVWGDPVLVMVIINIAAAGDYHRKAILILPDGTMI